MYPFWHTISLYRCDVKKRRYVGAVCGLGCDPITGQSLYRDHDIELTFDTLITQEDLDLVWKHEWLGVAFCVVGPLFRGTPLSRNPSFQEPLFNQK